MYIDNTNLAYDLSRFDNSDRDRERREKQRQKEAEARKIRMAPAASLSKSGVKMKAFAVIAVLFAAFFAVNFYNTKKDDTRRLVAEQQEVLNAAMDDNALLQSKLDAKVNIGYIEQYAKETLKMSKVGSAQKKYISVNTESLIEVDADDSEGFLGSVKKGFKSFLEYIGF